MKQYTSYDPYGTYENKGEDPYSILMKMSSWNKEIRSTISDVQETLYGTVERQSQIIQDVSGITSNVFEIDSRLGETESTIIQQAGLIASKVELTDYTGAKVTSLIVQDATSINLLAQQLNLKGLVTFTNLSTSGQTSIDGGNIIARSILASHLVVDNLGAISARLGTVTSGNINIYDSINIGRSVYMRGSGTGVYFDTFSQIYDTGGYLTIEGYNRITLVGNLDISNARFVGGTSVRYSSSSNRLYVDLNGIQQGWINLDG